MAAVMAESPTVSPEIKDPSAKLDDIKKSSKLMKIKKFSKHECTKEMKKHVKGITRLWLEADEAMEKKEDTKCENQGGLKIKGIDFVSTLFFRALNSLMYTFIKYIFNWLLGLLPDENGLYRIDDMMLTKEQMLSNYGMKIKHCHKQGQNIQWGESFFGGRCLVQVRTRARNYFL